MQLTSEQIIVSSISDKLPMEFNSIHRCVFV